MKKIIKRILLCVEVLIFALLVIPWMVETINDIYHTSNSLAVTLYVNFVFVTFVVIWWLPSLRQKLQREIKKKVRDTFFNDIMRVFRKFASTDLLSLLRQYLRRLIRF